MGPLNVVLYSLFVLKYVYGFFCKVNFPNLNQKPHKSKHFIFVVRLGAAAGLVSWFCIQGQNTQDGQPAGTTS